MASKILLFLFCCFFVALCSGAYNTSQNEFAIEERKHPDVGLMVPQLVVKYGYPLETHTVTTSDGYILTMHRIPYGKINTSSEPGKKVVFLMHGLLSSSADWVIMGPEKGLAFLLADLGYDVWMGNARGNTYSRKHNKFNPDKKKKKFWNFSWHEIGKIDIPAMIDYALENTNQKQLSYVAHSQGTTSFFVMTSTRPEYNEKIKVMIALAPVAFMKHIPNLAFKVLAQFHTVINWISSFIGAYEFLPSSKFMELIGQVLCNDNSIFQDVCSNVLFLIAGFDSDQLNKTMLPVILSNTPAGAATKQVLHYAQLVANGGFKQYNYYWENIIKYGQFNPPKYNLKNVKVPVVLLWGRNDALTDETDIRKLKDSISRPLLLWDVKHPKFNHLDFLWSKDVVSLLYFKVFDFLERF